MYVKSIVSQCIHLDYSSKCSCHSPSRVNSYNIYGFLSWVSVIDESEKHVMLLIELVPDWLKMVEIRAGKFVKMDKTKDINSVHQKLQQMLKKAAG